MLRFSAMIVVQNVRVGYRWICFCCCLSTRGTSSALLVWSLPSIFLWHCRKGDASGVDPCEEWTDECCLTLGKV